MKCELVIQSYDPINKEWRDNPYILPKETTSYSTSYRDIEVMLDWTTTLCKNTGLTFRIIRRTIEEESLKTVEPLA